MKSKKLLTLLLVLMMVLAVFTGCAKEDRGSRRKIPAEIIPGRSSLYTTAQDSGLLM
jgi:hypothetical protein